MRIRPARVGDVEPMRELIDRYAAEDRMLSRSREFLVEHLRDFIVAEDDYRGGYAPPRTPPLVPASPEHPPPFLGCCALAVLTPDLAEIRSLAVRPEASGRGVGRALVDACVTEARRLGLRRVFALTLVPDFFVRCGFVLTSLGHLPEKSAAECPICPKRFACDEQAMLMHLDGTTPEPLRPNEPWGYTRIFLGREPARQDAR